MRVNTSTSSADVHGVRMGRWGIRPPSRGACAAARRQLNCLLHSGNARQGPPRAPCRVACNMQRTCMTTLPLSPALLAMSFRE